MQGKTLIVHIGAHKTGSTTIQEAFASDQVAVKGAEILYPARLDHNYLRADFITHETGEPLPKRGPRQLGFDTLAQKIGESSADYALLSAEYFENIDPALMKDVLDKHFAPHVDRIRIIAYLRPHVARLLSGYGEALKIGWFSDDLDSFFKQSLVEEDLLFAPRFTRWQNVFGDMFTLRPMQPERLAGGSVLEDFLHVAFDGREVLSVPDVRQNQSLSVSDLVFLKLIQERFQNKNGWLRHTFGWEIARQLQASGVATESPRQKLQLHADLAPQVLAACAADARAVDQAFCAGEPVFEHALEAGCRDTYPVPVSLNPEDHFSAGELRTLRTLREVLWDMMQTKNNWAAFFHGQRVQDVERRRKQKSG